MISVALLLLAALAYGCGTPTIQSRKKITATSQAPGDRVNFVYKETSPQMEDKQGLIECSVQDDGTLADCKEIEIAFDEGTQTQGGSQ
jgi:hypothetical protein